MNKFVETWKNNEETLFTCTENGALTYKTSGNACVDLFFKIGAMRGQDTNRLIQMFKEAYSENPNLAVRILLWVRDIRSGAGERKIFRDIMLWLENYEPVVVEAILPKISELGRFDDLLIFRSHRVQQVALKIYEQALRDKNLLAYKFLPSEGGAKRREYNLLRNYLNLTPRQYRKLKSKFNQVVETKMSARQWTEINYSHVPSLAHSRYRKAFSRHDPIGYQTYSAALIKNIEEGVTTSDVKINAGAVYPYDVLKDAIARRHYGLTIKSEENVVQAQWAALPNYMQDKNILPLIDVSGSMASQVGNNKNLTCMTVAVSLGLYMATKNTGPFNGMFVTFHSDPQLVTLKSNDIIDNVQQVMTSPWGYSTNIDAALKLVLNHAVKNKVSQRDLPEYLVVLSDMEFDDSGDNVQYETYKQDFRNAGYEAPKIVWWNIQSRNDHSPIRVNDQGTALVSGFSPSIAKSIMSGEDISPVSIMLKTIMSDRYKLDLSNVSNSMDEMV